MSRSFFRVAFCSLVALFTILFGVGLAPTLAQNGSQGTVTITVLDPDGRAVPDADLTLQDLSTNDVRNAKSQDRGTYSFVNLSIGTYKLTVTKTGFQTQLFDTVAVHATQVTDVTVSLKVGVTSETIEVHESETPLIDTTSNAITSTIDMKQIEDLPLNGRDVTALASLVPGTGQTSGQYGGGSTWNGLPSIAQGNNIDGVISSTSRMKFGGNAEPAAEPRIENIQEMTVQTDQLDANQGFGQASMQINFVTRRGSNSFHGRAYEDFRNSYLNANSWFNDAAGINKGHLEQNEFGGSVGGPILKDKLFFFGSFSMFKSPGTRFPNATILDASAQSGIFNYTGIDGKPQQVNVYTLAGNCNANPSCTTTPISITPSSVIQSQFTTINGVLPDGKVTIPNSAFPDIQSLTWATPAAATTYFPTARLDYNVTKNFRLNFALNDTKAPPQIASTAFFPGAAFAGQQADFHNNFYTAAVGFDWTIRPTLVTQFRGGFLYNDNGFTNSKGYADAPTLFWGIGTSPQQYNLSTAQYYPLINASDTTTWQHGAHTLNFGFSMYREQDHYINPPGGIYGIGLGLSGSDPALNAFTLSTIPDANNGIVGNVQNLYATLVGDINGAGSLTGGFAGNGYSQKAGGYTSGSYNLDELQRAWGLFVQDSYRVKPNLTVNLSLRWDFTGDDHDLTNAYQGITSNADIYGPSGAGNLFMPGVLTGNPQGGIIAPQGHQYNSWNVSPQPEIGIAWTPQYSEGILSKLFGGSGNTVIRAGYGIRRFTEPYQYFWDTAADYAFGYLQQFDIAPSTLTGTGFYGPGSLTLAPGTAASTGLLPAGTGQLPPNAPCASAGISGCASNATGWSFVPTAFPKSTPESEFTFAAGGPALKGFDRNIAQPYSQSWNLGIQRQIGRNNALEIRYLGNRVVHQWIAMNLNEVNAFATKGTDPSFLNQFKQAQTNLNLNNVNASAFPAYAGTFAYNPAVTGEAAMPVFAAAFAGETGSLQSQDWGYPYFTQTLLPQGQAGQFANVLTNPSGGQGGANFFCNLVGASFAGCQNVGYTGAGAGYPINYFQVNPFYSGSQTFYQYSGGYSNYNALQVDFRQKQWHGMQFDANYTWSHNLGLSTPNDWQGGFNQVTLRNLRLGYAPTIYDLRHVIHVNGTYDLPFGKGKQYLNRNDLLDKVVGGWTIGTIFTFQTGFPFNLGGAGYNTYNDYSDGGVVLGGMSRSQLQSQVGVFHPSASQIQAYQAANCPPTGGQPATCVPTFVDFINPAILNGFTGGIPNSGTNNAFAFANTAAGTIIPRVYLYGPHFWNDDLAISKAIAIRENLRFSLQGEFLNVFNHPNFNATGVGGPYYTSMNTGVQNGGFGNQPGTDASGPRAIEIRANIEF